MVNLIPGVTAKRVPSQVFSFEFFGFFNVSFFTEPVWEAT